MSEDSYSDVYDDDYAQEPAAQAGGPKALREAYEKEKEARKALEERLARLERQDQAKQLASALEGKGVNPKAAELALSQGVTPDKVDEWVAQWGDLFGVTASEEQSSGGVDEATVQQIQAVSGAPTGTTPASSGGGDPVAALNAIDNEGDFWQFIKSQSQQ